MESEQTFLPGMYVRLPSPDEMGREDGEFRDFRIGQIDSVDDIALTALVLLETHAPDQEPQIEQVECPLHLLARCHILPESRFTHIPSGEPGEILAVCTDDWQPGELCAYYVQLAGEIQRISEAEITVSSVRQDPSPYHQLRRYEFQNPRWKDYRDQLIEGYSELHNASFGIEDLVGSRVMLLPHQAEVITRVLSSTECRFMLADEVGLGKTIEACVILKSLRRREPGLKTLIVAPASLVQQWYNELDAKFWLHFVVPKGRTRFPADSPGVIMSAEDLAGNEALYNWVCRHSWGLLIVDEAHHLRKTAQLHERIQHLSRAIERVLILTATPIQRHDDEYLDLLKLLDPARYAPMDKPAFQRILSAQNRVRQAIILLKPNLTADFFEVEEFQEEIDGLKQELAHDHVLEQLIEAVGNQAEDFDAALHAAQEVMSYVSENYRIEGRIIRNRRASLAITLPARELDTAWSYVPEQEELLALDELHGYIDCYLDQSVPDTAHLEYCRLLFHAAASSPQALLWLLELRQHHLTDETSPPSVASRSLAELATPADPRQESSRVAQLVQAMPVFAGEQPVLDTLLWHTRRWHEQTEQQIAALSRRELAATQAVARHRLVQVLRVLVQTMEQSPATKIVVFARWSQTLAALQHALRRFYPRNMVAQFHAGLTQDELQQSADRFQAQAECQILLCDELGGEGRNFQIADTIIHMDLPWTPAQIEQRIGRVDRLGRSGTVRSVVPFASDTVEQDLFRIWQDAFQLFTRSMSGMEIALEGIQNELAEAVTQSTRHGLSLILADMQCRAEQLREEVEKERYFEEEAINHRLRQQFQRMDEAYRDGSRLRQAFLPWAKLAGLFFDYHVRDDTVVFHPRRFNLKSMSNAKFLPPNMEEALRRSRNSRNPIITGTFNRHKAVQREDLVFFAPSDDPWTDAIIANAMEADRGRCCAILRIVPELEQDWQGFELLYRLRLDPRYLYAAGYPPSHLFRAQGFLATPTHRLLISHQGEVLKKRNPIWQYIEPYFSKGPDYHLGKRENPRAMLQVFKQRYPPDEWLALVEDIQRVAEAHIAAEYEFTDELAEEAHQEFAQRAAGWRAAQRWFMRETGSQFNLEEIAEYERVSAILVKAIRHPIIQLESVCFWVLRRKESDA